jgi:hypothetical protein
MKMKNLIMISLLRNTGMEEMLSADNNLGGEIAKKYFDEIQHILLFSDQVRITLMKMDAGERMTTGFLLPEDGRRQPGVNSGITEVVTDDGCKPGTI